MSGGVDSSVSALLLKEAGFEVIGLTLYHWDYSLKGITPNTNKTSPHESIDDARELSQFLGIKHIVADVRDIFENTVIKHFEQEYFLGHTPNPCVFCNKNLKWKIFLQYADNLDCSNIATGHYAKIREEAGRFIISKGNDAWKDQSFVLWQLPQSYLSRTHFPIGHLLKEEIKTIAQNAGWEKLSQKRESYNICFIPNDDYRLFLQKRNPKQTDNLKNGSIVSENGALLGKHNGFPFYTIGQKKGLQIESSIPLYVKDIFPQTNQLVVAEKSKLFINNLILKDINLIKYSTLEQAKRLTTCIRGKDAGTMGTVSPQDNRLEIQFDEKVFAVMPGQSAVCYENTDLVAGGIVANERRNHTLST